MRELIDTSLNIDGMGSHNPTATMGQASASPANRPTLNDLLYLRARYYNRQRLHSGIGYARPASYAI